MVAVTWFPFSESTLMFLNFLIISASEETVPPAGCDHKRQTHSDWTLDLFLLDMTVKRNKDTWISYSSGHRISSITRVNHELHTSAWRRHNIRELKQRRFWAADVHRKFMFLLLTRFHARPMSYKALILTFATWLFEWKGLNTHQRGEVSTSGWRPWLKKLPNV